MGGKLLHDVSNPLPHIVLADIPPLVDLPEQPGLLELSEILTTPFLVQNWMNEHLIYVSESGDSWQTAQQTFLLRGGDCEDWAIFACNILDYNGYETHLMGVYQKTIDSTGHVFYPGHSVCAVKIEDNYIHLGNWGLCCPSAVSLEELAYYIFTDWAVWEEYNKGYPFSIMSINERPV